MEKFGCSMTWNALFIKSLQRCRHPYLTRLMACKVLHGSQLTLSHQARVPGQDAEKFKSSQKACQSGGGEQGGGCRLCRGASGQKQHITPSQCALNSTDSTLVSWTRHIVKEEILLIKLECPALM